jgi:hypothetical protein
MPKWMKWNKNSDFRFGFHFALYCTHIMILKTRMLKWMKWSKKSDSDLGWIFFYIVDILCRQNNHNYFNDKNVEMDEMK